MAEVLELKDGGLVTPVNVFDVLDIVEEYLGTDVRQYLEFYFQDGVQLNLTESDSLEEMKDHYTQVLLNIDDLAEELEKKIIGKRFRREAVRNCTDQIRNIVRREGV